MKGLEENAYNPYVQKGMLEAERLLEKLSEAELSKTYWLCIFAVNEHRAICGDCWTCNKKAEWTQDAPVPPQGGPMLALQQ